MDKVNTAPSDATVKVDGQSSAQVSKRGKSAIAFVYADLEAAMKLATALHSRAGTTCEIKQLASWMNQSADGGTFRSVLGSAKTFGLVETFQGTVTLTTLGLKALDEGSRPNALADAFLNVPLHSAMYEQFKTHALPPAAAIERQIEGFGVPPKQKERARQTFIKSAQVAGYIDPPTGRFIRPASAPGAPPPDPMSRRKGGDGGGKDHGLDLDPLLMALLLKIPTVDEGWPKEQRLRWFRTFAMNVSQIYDTGDEVVDLAIKIESKDS